jgi:hypothetical protein
MQRHGAQSVALPQSSASLKTMARARAKHLSNQNIGRRHLIQMAHASF